MIAPEIELLLTGRHRIDVDAAGDFITVVLELANGDALALELSSQFVRQHAILVGAEDAPATLEPTHQAAVH